MTTFEDAARAEAERRWTLAMTPEHPLSAPERRNRRVGFDLGAKWARAYLAEQEEDEMPEFMTDFDWEARARREEDR